MEKYISLETAELLHLLVQGKGESILFPLANYCTRPDICFAYGNLF